MAYVFKRAEQENIQDCFSIIEKRVNWMESNGIKQWNATDYLNTYPIAYFVAHQKAGNLYVYQDIEYDVILGLMVLMPFDTRWEGYEAFDSYFVHNFATDPSVKGIGKRMLYEAELLAEKHGKTYLRLDCPSHNVYLNNFYENNGYRYIGTCIDGPYRGNRREKKLKPIKKSVFDVIFSRSSYRGSFSSKPVPKEDLKLIVNAGIAAPSGCNCQTPAFVIVDDAEKCKCIKDAFPRPSIQSAPAFIMVFTQSIPGIDGHFYNVEDYAAAIENILLAIKALGYESCWYQGGVRSCAEVFRRLVGMPDIYTFVCLLPVGVAAEEASPIKTKKSFEERAWFNCYNRQGD